MARIAGLALLLIVGCDTPGKQPDNGNQGTNTGNPTSGSGTPNALDCNGNYPTADPGLGGLPTCVTQEIHCGDSFNATLEGGSTVYTKDFWTDQMELGPLSSEANNILNGPERVFAFYDQAPDTEITITVDSCWPQWVSWRQYGDIAQDWCDPTANFAEAGHFTGNQHAMTYTLLNRSAGSYDWEIIVDSWDSLVGNFTITVECFN